MSVPVYIRSEPNPGGGGGANVCVSEVLCGGAVGVRVWGYVGVRACLRLCVPDGPLR